MDRRGRVEIDKDGMLHLSALAAMPDDQEPARTRDAIYRSIGSVQFAEFILEVDAATNFSDVLLGHRTRSQQVLLAHGTELDASDVALMIPGLEYAQVSIRAGAPTPLGTYTHLCDRWSIVYDQSIVLNERQAGVAIDGVEQYNRTEGRIRLSLLAVYAHGYSFCRDVPVEALVIRPASAISPLASWTPVSVTPVTRALVSSLRSATCSALLQA